MAAMVFGLVILSSQQDNDHDMVVNLLGRQRMLSQKLAKDANRISVIYGAIDSAERVSPVAELQAKVVVLKSEIEGSIAQFEATYSQVLDGRILAYDRAIQLYDSDDADIRAVVGEIGALWRVYKPAVSAVASSASFDRAARLGLISVNELDGKLLDASERLNSQIVARYHRQSEAMHALSIALVVGLSIVVLWLVFGSYRLLLEPYEVIYRGLRTLGAKEEKPKIVAGRSSPLMREVDSSFAALRRMVGVIGAISQGNSFADTLRLIFDSFRSSIPYDYIGVASFQGYSGTRLIAFQGVSDGSFSGLPSRLLGLTAELGDTSLGAILESGQPRVINDLEAHAAKRPPREYTRIILEEGIRSSITLPLVVNGKALGFLFFSSRKRNAYTEMHVSFLSNIRNAIALSFEKDIFVDELVYSSTLALAKMAEARDEDTASHLDRMRRYSVLVAESLRADGFYSESLSPDFIHSLDRFSPMHDIGKVGIRDAVLLKPGKLDAAELAHMRTHAIYGADVLREAENNIARSGRTLFTMGIRIAESHHERWDGQGYPHGLADEAIPLEARIVAVADVFDALTTRRPYKEPFEFRKSADMVLSGSGGHFDPAIVASFALHLDEILALYEEFRAASPESY